MSTAASQSGFAAEVSETACFSVQADATPGVLPRLLEILAKRGFVPSRIHATTLKSAEGPEKLSVDLQVGGVGHDLQALMAATMGQVYEVDRVLTARKSSLPAG